MYWKTDMFSEIIKEGREVHTSIKVYTLSTHPTKSVKLKQYKYMYQELELEIKLTNTTTTKAYHQFLVTATLNKSSTSTLCLMQ